MGECMLTRRGGAGGGVYPIRIEVATPPTKTTYYTGDTLDLTGIQVTAVYSSGNTVDVTDACIYSPASGETLSQEGTVEVNIKWTSQGESGLVTYKAIQTISIMPVVSYLSFATIPTKIAYVVGEPIDYTGLSITVGYKSGRTKTVIWTADNTDFTLSPENGKTRTEGYGTWSVTVKYTDPEAGSTATVQPTSKFQFTYTPKMVAWATGTDAEIVDMVAYCNNNDISLTEYWAVGDTRTVKFKRDSTGTNTMEADLVLLDSASVAEYKYSSSSNGSFIVGFTDVYKQDGTNPTSYVYSSSSSSSAYWYTGKSNTAPYVCDNLINGTYIGIVGIAKAFSQMYITYIYGSDYSSRVKTYGAVAGEFAIFGTNTYTQSSESEQYKTQFEWYKIAANRKKSMYYWTITCSSPGYAVYVGGDGETVGTQKMISSAYVLPIFLI